MASFFDETELLAKVAEQAKLMVGEALRSVQTEMGDAGQCISFDEEEIQFDAETSRVYFPNIEFPSEDVRDKFMCLVRERFGNPDLTIPSRIGQPMTPSEKRFVYLLNLAEKSQWKFGVCFSAIEIGSDLGFSSDESERIILALSKSGYVDLVYGPQVYITHPGLDKAEELKLLNTQQTSLLFLQAANAAARPPLGYVETNPIQQRLGISEALKMDALRYLDEKGYIKVIDDSWSLVQVTAAGQDQLARSMQSPSTPTAGFPAANNVLVNYGNISHSQVGQAGANVTQTGSFQLGIDPTELLGIIAQLKEQLPQIAELTVDAKEEAEA